MIHCGGDHPGDVAVGDELDSSSRSSHLVDVGLIAGTIQDDGCDVRHRLALRLRDGCEVFGHRGFDVDHSDAFRTCGDLVHVHDAARRIHRSTVGESDHRQGSPHAARCECRSIDRVDGDVDLRSRSVADPLAVVEHRRLVLLALADDDDAVHVDR